jgi:hypothetical protein
MPGSSLSQLSNTTLTQTVCWDYTGGTEDFRYQVNAVVHELFHALGFSSSLFGQWRNSQGEPYDSGTPHLPHACSQQRDG